ncbi:MAG: hypothetical protein PHP44_06355 [Kiritimatiellae bacterium]|nr:hypothetical protein [Kiritimatiellia bacterium]
MEKRAEKLPMIGKTHGIVSNDWKNRLKSFQWLEKMMKKFPLIGKRPLGEDAVFPVVEMMLRGCEGLNNEHSGEFGAD